MLNASGDSTHGLAYFNYVAVPFRYLEVSFFADVTNGVANIFSAIFCIVYKDEYKLWPNIL